jgi:hypothetical protein
MGDFDTTVAKSDTIIDKSGTASKTVTPFLKFIVKGMQLLGE